MFKLSKFYAFTGQKLAQLGEKNSTSALAMLAAFCISVSNQLAFNGKLIGMYFYPCLKSALLVTNFAKQRENKFNSPEIHTKLPCIHDDQFLQLCEDKDHITEIDWWMIVKHSPTCRIAKASNIVINQLKAYQS